MLRHLSQRRAMSRVSATTGPQRRPDWRSALFSAAFALFAVGVPAAAQTPASAPKAEGPVARMVVEARELVNDENNNTITAKGTAKGDVQINYNICQIYAPAANRALGGSLLRGIGGAYDSATVETSWKRKVIDPLGGVWTPFAFARFSGSYLNYDNSGTTPIYNNSYQPIPNGGVRS